MFRHWQGELQALLAHPGGPFFAGRDEGHWTIPKGEAETGEELLCVARREFAEETGLVTEGPFIELGSIRQKGGKIVHAWAVTAAGSLAREKQPSIQSNCFQLEWPPGSQQLKSFPEVDRAEFFSLPAAHLKIKETQRPFLDKLQAFLAGLKK